MPLETLFPLNFSQSMMSDVWNCELQFFRRYCQKLRSPGKKNSDLVAGGYFASACEIVRNSYYTDNLSDEESIETGAAFILSSPDTGHDVKSNERLAFCLKKYFKKFPLDSEFTPLALADGTHAIEYAFAFDLGIKHPELDKNILFTGKLDMLTKKTFFGNNVKYCVIDEKTTGSIRRLAGTKLVDLNAETETYKTSAQLTCYNWAARQLGIHTTLSIIRRVPIMREFEPSFALEIPIDDFLVNLWFTSTINKIEELVEKYKWYLKNGLFANSFYPSLGKNCDIYFKPCEYKVGCYLPEGEEILSSTYVQVVGHPESSEVMSLNKFKQTLEDIKWVK